MHKLQEIEQRIRPYYVLLMLLIIEALLTPINHRLIEFPEWGVLVAAVILIVANIYMRYQGKAKKMGRIIFAVASVIVILWNIYQAYCSPYWNTCSERSYSGTISYDEVISCEDAIEDLNYLMKYVKKCHPIYLEADESKVNELEKRYETAVTHLKEADVITTNGLKQEMQLMLSCLGDGHTFTGAYFQNEGYLLDAIKYQEEGYEIVAVNDVSIEELFEANKEFYCYELEAWGIEQMQNQLKKRSGLAFLGIDGEKVTYTWENQAGETIAETYTAEDFVSYKEYMQQIEANSTEGSEAFVSYEIDKERSLAVLTLSQCIYNEEYCKCLEDMFTEVKEQSIEHVAVDLRGNSGGNSQVANAFMSYLDIDEYHIFSCPIVRRGAFNMTFSNPTMKNVKNTDLLYQGKVYVLTDTATFSSAVDFTELIQGNDLGIVIGEIPSNSPNSYGDVAVFETPNTGIMFQVSTKKWLRVNQDETDPVIHPDIECDSREVYTYLYEAIAK